jgi:hypothetical protein
MPIACQEPAIWIPYPGTAQLCSCYWPAANQVAHVWRCMLSGPCSGADAAAATSTYTCQGIGGTAPGVAPWVAEQSAAAWNTVAEYSLQLAPCRGLHLLRRRARPGQRPLRGSRGATAAGRRKLEAADCQALQSRCMLHQAEEGPCRWMHSLPRVRAGQESFCSCRQ